MTNATILQTFNAEIKGKFVTVSQMKERNGKTSDDIFYMVNGRRMSPNDYWAKKPKQVN